MKQVKSQEGTFQENRIKILFLSFRDSPSRSLMSSTIPSSVLYAFEPASLMDGLWGGLADR